MAVNYDERFDESSLRMSQRCKCGWGGGGSGNQGVAGLTWSSRGGGAAPASSTASAGDCGGGGDSSGAVGSNSGDCRPMRGSLAFGSESGSNVLYKQRCSGGSGVEIDSF